MNEVFWVLGDRYTLHQKSDAVSIIEIESKEEHGPPPHIHATEAESFFVLEGQFSVEVEGRSLEAGPGEFIHIPAGKLHTYRATSPGANRQLVIITPGHFADLFKKIGIRETLPGNDPGESEGQVEQLVALAQEYGLTLAG